MKSKINLLVVCTLISIGVSAQSPSYDDYYDWNSSPKLHEIPDSIVSDYPGVIILEKKVIEYVISGAGAVSFESSHRIVHINNDAGVERFNKVYIPVRGESQLITLNVRSINKAGNITNFDRANLKELKNVENYGNFKIFAIEGIEKGGELEYFYTLKSTPQTFGRTVLQQDVPVNEAIFEIIYPERLFFTSKSYNGLPAMKSRYIGERRNELVLNQKDIPALNEEPYSSYRANLMKVDFRFDGNSDQVGATSWASISQRLIKYLSDNGAKSKVRNLLETINVDGLQDVDKLKKIESYIKSHFTIKEGYTSAYEDLKEIIATHVANERGIVKLYVSIFNLINMQPQLVFACNRAVASIDPDFPTYSDLDEILFYFDAYKLYLSPKIMHARIGFASSAHAASNALFIDFYFDDSGKPIYQKYKVKVIEPLDFLLNDEGVRASVKFTNEFNSIEVDMEKRWQGYRASGYRGSYYYKPEAQREEFLNDATFSGIDNYKVLSRKIEGENIELSSNPSSYFTVKTKFETTSLVEKAGDDYLLAIGKIIGKQSELYQEKKRQSDILFYETSNYNHEIVVEIPAGYKCTGLEAIKINNKVVQKGQDVMYFNSDYILEGNKLTIKVTEVYKVLNLPAVVYDDFRRMINSAADFNKVVLVLQKI
jgi:hypothetical protein